ncbi:helix-turn-helix domain-containing protein [Micromonospora sp. NPDC002389]|uniref:AraC family transcriptional regulator n=1 Tax=Micromonospora sp. NPDC002389 TaxID=3154272 RepID=UPI00332E6B2D
MIPSQPTDTAVGTGPSPWRRLAITGVDEVHAFFAATFANNKILLSDTRSHTAHLRGMGATLDDIVLTGLRYPVLTRMERLSDDLVNFIHIRTGRLTVTDRHDDAHVTPGHTIALPTGLPLQAEFEAVESFTVGIPQSLLDEIARIHSGGVVGKVQFEQQSRPSPELERHWLGTLGYVRQVVMADTELAANPLIIGQIRQLLASAALAVFPNTAPELARRGPGHVSRTVVSRAMGYVESHADRYVSLTEMADAAGVSARALQYAFRRHEDTTPARYARRLRLEHAHRELQTSDPTTGATVTAIAARWGFVDAKRFATDYRAAYGHPPSQTLRN